MSRDSRAIFHRRPTPYHLMLRTADYAWWRPVVGILVAVVAFFIGASAVYLAIASFYAIFQGGAWAADVSRNIDTAHVGPATLLGLNLGLASMILVTWALVRVLHGLRPRWLASVAPRLRWRFLAVCLGFAALALVAQIAVGALLPRGTEDDLSGGLNHFTTRTAVSAVIVMLTTPLQAAGEEYLFRGYLLQAFGAFFGNRWVAITATATLFALAHGAQNPPLFFDRLAFGLLAGWLVTRTGGLEAGIALHVLNNFLAFGIALAFGDLTSTLTVSTVSWWNIVLTVTQSGVYIVLVVMLARRWGLRNTTEPAPGANESTSGPAVATA
jgi:membrane protease YdiL (CAAX protease family)